MSKFKDPIAWLYGLISGAIGGGATAGVSTLGLLVGNVAGADVKPLDFKQVGAVFLSGAVMSAILYLKQSPLPPLDESTSSTSSTGK